MTDRYERFDRIIFKFKFAITFLAIVAAATFSLSVSLKLSPKAAADEDGGIKLPVIMYHLILSNSGRAGEFIITPEMFRSDMEYIKQNGYNTVVMEDVIAYVKNGAPLPENPVMITLDDGYYNNYLYAYPTLMELDMRAIISIIGIEADRYSESMELNENYSHCTWEQLSEMSESGVIELQNHSYDLHHIEGSNIGIKRRSGEEIVAYRTRLFTDLTQMQQRFRDELGITPSTFTYPFGCSESEGREVIKSLGFTATLGTNGATFYVSRDETCLSCIPRYNRTSTKSVQQILESA